ncbi:DUF6286 domain-containing Asp23/Gls24 family envelope stress response protein [Streptomyces sp. NRRL S-1521]|uniref:DUF6286 domain-containing Asp23/Gls24 family envelope stress response protein n=1 Tax=Streptomyces sp. NRRL S-1521 TaxID=1609100 RepID=UPI0007474C01|nr:DUF6286 domain-containing protein [Streptomyces sp. NRRL S-1521]KUL54120.1 hypothetical protein ADL30_16730 [Streptomyces sp. NRRL S-1521]
MSTPAAERGSTTVTDRAVRRIAERAATEALGPGEVQVGRGSAVVQGRRARVGVTVTLPYPAVLDEAGERVRSHVAGRTAELTGLTVPSARVRVRALRVRELPQEAASTGAVEAGEVRARRPWSERRAPVAVVACLVTAACGLLLYDVVSVHAAGRAPARWRTRSVEWLSAHGPDGAAWPGLAVAAGVFALGVWLLVLAVTPGLRGRLPMAAPVGVRASVDRRAVAALLRDAVADVPGIGRVRVDVGRRRARVRAGLRFGARKTARAAVAEAAEEAAASCGLARPLRVHVRVRPEAVGSAPPEPPAAVPASTVRGGAADEPAP